MFGIASGTNRSHPSRNFATDDLLLVAKLVGLHLIKNLSNRSCFKFRFFWHEQGPSFAWFPVSFFLHFLGQVWTDWVLVLTLCRTLGLAPAMLQLGRMAQSSFIVCVGYGLLLKVGLSTKRVWNFDCRALPESTITRPGLYPKQGQTLGTFHCSQATWWRPARSLLMASHLTTSKNCMEDMRIYVSVKLLNQKNYKRSWYIYIYIYYYIYIYVHTIQCYLSNFLAPDDNASVGCINQSSQKMVRRLLESVQKRNEEKSEWRVERICRKVWREPSGEPELLGNEESKYLKTCDVFGKQTH